jgi:hypothetical protein
MYVLLCLGVKYELNQPVPVPEIDENKISVVPI